MKVFIADDSRVIRGRLVALLSDLAGVEICGQAEDAFSAIKEIRALAPDVVILDIHFPGSSSGIFVLERIKRERNAPVIIMLTNYSDQQYRKRCIDAGAAFFFDKSTEFEKVPEVLSTLVSNLTRPSPVHD